MDHSMHSTTMDPNSMHDHGSMIHGSHDTTMDHGTHGDHDSHGATMDPGMGGHGSHATMDHMDMMKMWFHGGVTEVILFENWKINSIGGLIGSMIGIFLMAILYEGLKYFREYLFRRSYSSVNFSCINNAGDGPKVMPQPHGNWKSRLLGFSHIFQTFLHILQVTLSYFLMLIFMTYNVWLCLAVILGAGVGFFIFGWKKAIVVDITEHCH